MLEIRRYTKPELTAMLGTKSVANIKKKLERYNVEFDDFGRGEKAIFDIKAINDPLKVFCITELGFDANTDFRKLAYFTYCYFNDEEFMAMPDEVKSTRLDRDGKYASRQTIATYTRRFERNDLIYRNTDNYIYYFAYGKHQNITDKKTYCKAWKLYWDSIRDEATPSEAMWNVRYEFGGSPRKQAIPQTNAFHLIKIETLIKLSEEVIEEDMLKHSNQPINS